MSIGEILQLILEFSLKQINVEVDSNRIRPVDIPIIEAEIEKLVRCTGWKREITLRDTIKETLDYWRARL